MATTVDEILVRFLGDTRSFDRALFHFRANMGGLGRDVALATTAITGMFAAATAGAINAAASFEQTTVAFQTMIGSVGQANALLKQIGEFARTTPFNISEVEDQGRVLLALGFAAHEILPTLNDVGNVVAGIGIGGGRLQRVIFNLGQVRTQTLLTSRDLRDFAVNGIPILDTLAKTVEGVSDNLVVARQQIRQMITRRQISDQDVIAAFRSMASEGGKFFNLMQRQAKTFFGVWNNIKDSIILSARELGKEFLPAVTAASNALLELIRAFQHSSPEFKRMTAYGIMLGTVLSGIVTIGLTFGSMFIVVGNQAAQLIGTLRLLYGGFLLNTLIWRAATAAVMGLVGGLIAAGAAALGFYAIKLGYHIQKEFRKDAIKEFNDELQRTQDLISSQQDIQLGIIQGTLGGIESETDVTKRSQMIDDALQSNRNNMNLLLNSAEDVRREAESLAPTIRSLWQATGDRDLTLEKLTEIQYRLNLIGEEYAKLILLRDEMIAKDHALKEEADDLFNKLDEIERARGKSKEQFQLDELRATGRVAPSYLDEIQAKIDLKEANDVLAESEIELQKERDKAADDRVKRLADMNEELATIGMTSGVAAMYRIAVSNLSEEEKEEALVLQDAINQKKKAQDILDSYTDKIKELKYQLIGLKESEEAEKRARLEDEGFSPPQVDEIMTLTAEVDKLSEASTKAQQELMDLWNVMNLFAGRRDFHTSQEGLNFGSFASTIAQTGEQPNAPFVDMIGGQNMGMGPSPGFTPMFTPPNGSVFDRELDDQIDTEEQVKVARESLKESQKMVTRLDAIAAAATREPITIEEVQSLGLD